MNCSPNVAPRRRVSEFVADASAVLAFARGEKGEQRVAAVREYCIVSSLNLLEAFSKLVRYDMPAERVQQFLRESFPRVIPLDRELAELSAVFHAHTHKLGLSYADSVCLVLGKQRKATVLTADRDWKKLNVNVKVELIR
jgi:ribonuclease VapC